MYTYIMYKDVHVTAGQEFPEVEYRYSFTLSLTSALYVLFGQSNPSAALHGKEPVPFV